MTGFRFRFQASFHPFCAMVAPWMLNEASIGCRGPCPLGRTTIKLSPSSIMIELECWAMKPQFCGTCLMQSPLLMWDLKLLIRRWMWDFERDFRSKTFDPRSIDVGLEFPKSHRTNVAPSTCRIRALGSIGMWFRYKGCRHLHGCTSPTCTLVSTL